MNPDAYHPFDVPDDLQPYIRRVLAAKKDEPIRMEVYPRATGYCYIGCVPRGRWRGWDENTLLFDSDRDGPLHVSGQIKSDHIRVLFDGPIIQVFAEFTALGQYQLLGVNGSETVDRACSPAAFNNDRCGALSGRFATDDLKEIVTEFLAQLSSLARHPLDVPDYLHKAVENLESENPKLIADLASDLGLSERQFRREFTKKIGLAPKEFESVVQVTRALSWLLSKPGTDLADLAAQTGFSDQAHLTRAFQKFLGDSPRSMSTSIEATFAKFVGQCR